MRKLCTMLAALFFVLFSIGQIVAQSPAAVTLVRAGHLLDPKTGNVLSPAAVLIENGKIKEVGSPTQLQGHALGGQRGGSASPAGAHASVSTEPFQSSRRVGSLCWMLHSATPP